MFKRRTGSGIWLHGTPPDQFARAPLATDGCLVLANPDLPEKMRLRLLRIAALASAMEFQLAPHVWGSAVLWAASLQLAAAIPGAAARSPSSRTAAPAGWEFCCGTPTRTTATTARD